MLDASKTILLMYTMSMEKPSPSTQESLAKAR